MEKVLVTGSTGVLGRQLLAALQDGGREAVGFSRTPQRGSLAGDLLTGRGVQEALSSVHTVIHAATNPKSALDDLQMGQNLLNACQRSGVQHFIYVSIAGVNYSGGYDYYRSKFAVERLVERGSIPYTIQRATPFHEFAALLLRMLRFGPLQFVPQGVNLQPVEAAAVAAEVAHIACGDAQGHPPDLAGPEIMSLEECARLAGYRPVVLPIPHPAFRAMRQGPHGRQAKSHRW
ncbi:SDR family oxidoreductase [Deinococcus radiophilus]|uniref:SDR family oxidoreductase n=1 Tax=Deinococcus radiophilus TaxID=32062 RepID=UPI0036086EAC